jgi:hypothetical protein
MQFFKFKTYIYIFFNGKLGVKKFCTRGKAIHWDRTSQSDAIIEQQHTQVIEQTMKQLGVCHELRFIMYLFDRRRVACNIERCVNVNIERSFDKT